MSSTAALPVTKASPVLSNATKYTPVSSVEIAKDFGHDPEDLMEVASSKSKPWSHCTQEFGTRMGVLPRNPAIGVVGSSGAAWGGAAAGFVIGTILWGALGITSIAVNRNNRYHSDLRGILFLAIGIPAFTLIGAAIGACAGDGRSKD